MGEVTTIWGASEPAREEWPGGFGAGDWVAHNGRSALVIRLPDQAHAFTHDLVPIMYDGHKSGFYWVSARDLRRVDRL